MFNSILNGVPFSLEIQYKNGAEVHASIQLWQVTPHPIEITLRILCTFSFTKKKPLACTGQSHKDLTPEVDLQFVATNPAYLVELGIVVGLPETTELT